MSGYDDHDKTEILSAKDLSLARPKTRTAYLIMIKGRHVGKMYKLGFERVVLGRSGSAEIKIEDQGVSREHAYVQNQGGALILVDNNSTNGVFVNGNRIRTHALVEGDRVQIGENSMLKFDFADEVEEKAQERLFQDANCDSLTGAFNKRYFNKQLEAEFAFHFRHRQPLSLMMFDIDHFKSVNDTFGHRAGDDVLSTLSAIVKKMLRTEDLFARYGGEEFVILLRDTDGDTAFLIAERIRRAIEKHDFMFEDKAIPVFVSVGVSTLSDQDVADPESLLQVADDFLYSAKGNGRNRTESSVVS